MLQPSSIILNSLVFKIAQSPEKVLVSAARGDFSGKKVIIAVQSLVYKSITFDSPLPTSKLALADHGVQSCSFKNILLFSEPW
jgi:monoamine oxidase